jgi:hypothetical protein
MNNVGCNTHVHGSNARNLSVWLFLSQTRKTLCFSCYLSCFLFNEIREQEGGQFCLGARDMVQIMYTHVSKRKNSNKKNIIPLHSIKNSDHVQNNGKS